MQQSGTHGEGYCRVGSGIAYVKVQYSCDGER